MLVLIMNTTFLLQPIQFVTLVLALILMFIFFPNKLSFTICSFVYLPDDIAMTPSATFEVFFGIASVLA